MVKKKVKKKNKRKLFTILLIISVLVYFIIMSIPILKTSSAKTTPVQKGEIVDFANSKGIISKDEIIYKAETKGNIYFTAKEGEKLSKDSKIAEINNATYENYKTELKELDLVIEDYNTRISSQKEILKKDIQKNQGEIDYIIKEVQKNVADQNYEEVNRLKDRLLIISDKKDAITNEKTLIMEQLSTAMKKKSELISKMKQSNLIYYAETSGIVSKTIDGFEDQYSSRNLSKYRVSDIKELEIKEKTVDDKEEVVVGKPIFKIIEDQSWNILTKVEGEKLGKLRVGKIVPIIIDKGPDKIDATIVKLDRSKNDAFLVLELDKHLHDYYKKRYIDLKVIKNIYSGLEVPHKAIIEKDGLKGVYIKDISGVVKFRRVNILKQTAEKSIVESVEGEKPLDLFDEVYIDGRRIKEGQIVNSKGGV